MTFLISFFKDWPSGLLTSSRFSRPRPDSAPEIGDCEIKHLASSAMDPLDPPLTTDRIGDPVDAIANDAEDALDTGHCEDLSELICYCTHNPGYPFRSLRTRSTMAPEFPT